MKKVSIIGTVGVPANYGGFETLVENMIGAHASPSVKYYVYCSSKSYPVKRKEYKGARLIYIPLKANGPRSALYDILSMIHASFSSDILLILGVSGCLFLPFLRLFFWRKIIVNIDGLEHRREKWGKFARWFLKTSEAMAVRCANVVVSDNKAIQDYVTEEYGKASALIEYGGDQVLCDIQEIEQSVLEKYNLKRKDYAMTVCRIEPENNVHLILEAFELARQKIVFVGNWENSDYGRELWKKYETHPTIQLLAPIYNLKVLNVLRSNANYYVHGHSAGGTNPSLVEAMFFGCPILAFDCKYNRETTENKAIYFKNASHLSEIIRNLESSSLGKEMLNIAKHRYCWKTVISKYNDLWEAKLRDISWANVYNV